MSSRVIILAVFTVGQQENSLQMEEQTEEQLNKILQDSDCHSDYIISPIDKHETQRSSVGGAHMHLPLGNVCVSGSVCVC